MSNSNPAVTTTSSRPVTETNERGLLLTGFSGEVYRAFEDSVAVADKLATKAVPPGQESVQFLRSGKLNAFYMQRGDELAGQDFRVTDFYVHVDKPLVAPFESYDFDRILESVDQTSEMANAAGQALARKFDLDALITLVRGSFIYAPKVTNDAAGLIVPADNPSGYASGDVVFNRWDQWGPEAIEAGLQPGSRQPGGTVLYSAIASGTRSAAHALELYENVLRCDEIWDEMDAPTEGRMALLRTSDFYTLANYRGQFDAASVADGSSQLAGNFVNKQILTGLGGAGTPMDGFKIGNVTVFHANGGLNGRFPKRDIGWTAAGSTTTGVWPEAKYSAPLSNCKIIAFINGAAANVIKQAVNVETTRDTRKQIDFSVAKMMGGHDVLQPMFCITTWDIAAGDSSNFDTITPTGDTAAGFGDAAISAEGGFADLSVAATNIYRTKDSTSAGASSAAPTDE